MSLLVRFVWLTILEVKFQEGIQVFRMTLIFFSFLLYLFLVLRRRTAQERQPVWLCYMLSGIDSGPRSQTNHFIHQIFNLYYRNGSYTFQNNLILKNLILKLRNRHCFLFQLVCVSARQQESSVPALSQVKSYCIEI